MATSVVRCPYCVLDHNFREMVAHLAQRRGKLGSAAARLWWFAACHTRLRDAGHAVWLWFSKIGASRLGDAQDPSAPREISTK